MRRTDQEFKAEVLRRSEQYRAKQKQLQKKMFTTALCFVLVITGFYVTLPMLASGGATEAAANDSAAYEPGASPAEGIYGIPEAEEQIEMGSLTGDAYKEEAPESAEPEAHSSGSRRYDIISVEVYTSPAAAEYERIFTQEEKIVVIMNAIEHFYTIDTDEKILETVGDADGMSYQIIVKREHKTQCYTLFNNGLYSEVDGCWISVDEEAYKRLEKAITQESDPQ